jgi:hypothetical protein
MISRDVGTLLCRAIVFALIVIYIRGLLAPQAPLLRGNRDEL